MFTPEILGDVSDREGMRRILTVQFTDGTTTFSRDFTFRLTEDAEIIKRAIAAALDEINYVPPPLEDLTLPTNDTKPTLTPEEVARAEWLKDWRQLEAAKRLIENGVLSGAEPDLIALRERVIGGYRADYLTII